ncbi:hypothetical protein Rhow_001635 [Rhodococcus wratislaviensis]|uniref:Uncharacterized protein n=1 Tax=Rhodococcus wratislaviensis TaxID=44752 RepID=A0A402BYG5_RHOWR|nr:hypothetical protein Rhow_001635 [Rhodococcus wratislaviensis]
MYVTGDARLGAAVAATRADTEGIEIFAPRPLIAERLPTILNESNSF